MAESVNEEIEMRLREILRAIKENQIPTEPVPTGKTTWQDIYALNRDVVGPNPDLIFPGQKLKLPSGEQYTVKPGDWLSKIADKQVSNINVAMPPATKPEPIVTMPPAVVPPAPVSPAGQAATAAPAAEVPSTVTTTMGEPVVSGSGAPVTAPGSPVKPTKPTTGAAGVKLNLKDPTHQTYAAMLGAESGNRDYYPAGHARAGQPIVSPVGAKYAAQVTPATAAKPGYGIRPAQADTPEEYNRVGQQLHQAMLRKYGGDETKATAAYNWGAGNLDRAIKKYGDDYVKYLPRETRNYLQRVDTNRAQIQAKLERPKG